MTKAIGEAKITQKTVEDETVVDMAQDEPTLRQETIDKEEGKIELAGAEGVTEAQDSLLEELLNDEDEEL